MPYATEADVKDEFGATNVDKWADLNNNGNAGEITARIGVALAEADLEINRALRGGIYSVPFDPTPAEIVPMAAKMAGVILYSARGKDDSKSGVGRYDYIRTDVADELRKIRTGTRYLETPVPTAASVPQVFADEDE